MDKKAEPKCWCETCRPITMDDMRMVLCPTCGNKRCPHATDHRNACTGSNKPGQKGSSYEHCKPAEQAEQEPVAWRKCAFCGIEHQIKSEGYILDAKTDEVFCRKCYVHTHEQEPVGNRIVGNDADGYIVENLYASPQSVNWSDRAVQIRALQAIGAEWYDGKIRNQWIADTCHELTKVIGGAVPVRTKDLTDDELDEIYSKPQTHKYQYARAIIAADREKNRG